MRQRRLIVIQWARSFEVKYPICCGDTENRGPCANMHLLNQGNRSITQPCDLLSNPYRRPIKPTDSRPGYALYRNVSILYLIEPTFKYGTMFRYRERDTREFCTPNPTCVLRR